MRFVAIAIFVGLLTVAPDRAAAQAEEPVVFTETTCRELLTRGEEQQNILIFFHGVVSGRRGETTVDVPKLQAISETIISACIDAPSAKLIDVFEDNR